VNFDVFWSRAHKRFEVTDIVICLDQMEDGDIDLDPDYQRGSFLPSSFTLFGGFDLENDSELDWPA